MLGEEFIWVLLGRPGLQTFLPHYGIAGCHPQAPGRTCENRKRSSNSTFHAQQIFFPRTLARDHPGSLQTLPETGTSYPQGRPFRFGSC